MGYLDPVPLSGIYYDSTGKDDTVLKVGTDAKFDALNKTQNKPF